MNLPIGLGQGGPGDEGSRWEGEENYHVDRATAMEYNVPLCCIEKFSHRTTFGEGSCTLDGKLRCGRVLEIAFFPDDHGRAARASREGR